jgi:uncharacterized protein YcnI
MGKRIVLMSAMAGAMVLALAAPAAAHISVDPSSAPQGSTRKLSFVVPNEEPAAKVTEVQIAFPTPPHTPINSVAVEAKPGWTVKVTTQKLAKPIKTDDGTVSEIVSSVAWKAKTAADGILPEQFGEFTINADGLPSGENEVVFRAVQTYSDGTVVRWIDPVTTTGPAAEHPTPILALTPPEGEATATTSPTPTTAAPSSSNRTTIIATSTQDNSARALGIVGIVLGAVALILATAALMKKRR